jgi:hypothetical protein
MKHYRLLRPIARNVKNAAFCAISYALVLAGGTFVLLVVVSAVGYLPYSDRPGPGWHAAHIPALQEVGYYASWAIFFVGPFALLWGILLFALVRALGWLGTPRWLVRTITAVFAFFLSLLGLAATGWYIAIAGVIVYGGAAIAALFSAWIFTHFMGASGPLKNNWLRWVGAAVAVSASCSLVIYPMLPDRDAQSLEVVLERLVPGPDEIGSAGGLTKDEVSLLNSLDLRGELRGGIQSSSSGTGEKHARALIVVREPLTSKTVLREPKATNVVYVQEGGTFLMYPSDAPTIRRRITLVEGNGEFEGLTVEIDPVIGKPSTFTWYPPIKRVKP